VATLVKWGNRNDNVKLANPNYPTLKPNWKWIGWSVAKIWPFKILPGRLFQKWRSVSFRSSVGQRLSTLYWRHALLFPML